MDNLQKTYRIREIIVGDGPEYGYAVYCVQTGALCAETNADFLLHSHRPDEMAQIKRDLGASVMRDAAAWEPITERAYARLGCAAQSWISKQEKTPVDPDRLVSLAAYAAQHGITPDTLRQRIRRGLHPEAVKPGHDWLIPASAPYRPDGRKKQPE